MLTGNGENNGLFWRKKMEIETLLFEFGRWPDENRHKILFFEDNFLCFNTLKIPAPTIEYSHREGFRGHVSIF
jgi:hypothetical protein